MVLLILGVLLGLVVGLARHTREAAARGKAVAELGELHDALARYYARFEAYPDPASVEPVGITDIVDLVPAWAGEGATPLTLSNMVLRAFLPSPPPTKDPWSTPYWYQHDPTNAPLAYRLFSLGPNTNNPNARVFFQP